MALTELQKGSLRSGIFSLDQVIDPDTGLPYVPPPPPSVSGALIASAWRAVNDASQEFTPTGSDTTLTGITTTFSLDAQVDVLVEFEFTVLPAGNPTHVTGDVYLDGAKVWPAGDGQIPISSNTGKGAAHPLYRFAYRGLAAGSHTITVRGYAINSFDPTQITDAWLAVYDISKL